MSAKAAGSKAKRRTGLGHFYGDKEVRCDLCREWIPADEWELVGDENSRCPACGEMDSALTVPQTREPIGETS